MGNTIRIVIVMAGLAACAGSGTTVPPMPALRADGTRIVDDTGAEVVLKGVNLGGWLFNETWITQIDDSLTSRIYVLGQRESFAADVIAVLRQGQDESWGGDEGYLTSFQAALAARIGEAAAAAFTDKVRRYLPVLYADADLPLRRKLSERFGDEVRDELLDLFQEAWIGEADIAWIAEQGFNVVRGEFRHPDVFDDDIETLKDRLSAYGSLQWDPNPRLLEILRSGLRP